MTRTFKKSYIQSQRSGLEGSTDDKRGIAEVGAQAEHLHETAS